MVPTTDQPGSKNNLFIWGMRARSLILVISYQIPRFYCRLWGTVSSPILVRFYIFGVFWKATMLIHSFFEILSSLATLGCHPTTEFKKCVFFVSFFSVLYFWDYKWWWVPTPEMRKTQKTPEMDELDWDKKSLKFWAHNSKNSLRTRKKKVFFDKKKPFPGN